MIWHLHRSRNYPSIMYFHVRLPLCPLEMVMAFLSRCPMYAVATALAGTQAGQGLHLTFWICSSSCGNSNCSVGNGMLAVFSKTAAVQNAAVVPGLSWSTEICFCCSWCEVWLELTRILRSELFSWLKWQIPEILDDSGKPLFLLVFWEEPELIF